ncbi:MAG: glycosyltransferase [candidate division NC10 bacterium]|nr:glycosyltransferase [candidate division NC10 bacterium]
MTDSLRVLMISDVSPLAIEGGGERVLWEQASRLVKLGHRVRILSRSPRDGLTDTVERQGVSIHHFPVDRRSLMRFFVSSIRETRQAVARILAEEDCDVLHLQQPLSGYGALDPDRARDLPSLYTFLSPAPLEYISRRRMTGLHRPGLIGRAGQVTLWAIERACLRRATRIHVLSDFSAGQLWKLYGIPSDRIVKIPGGADLERFRPAPDRRAVRASLGLPHRSPVLLTVRNLEARMGLDSLIRALAILRRHVADVLLLIGGAGTLRGPLESLAASLGLQEHVRFLGYVPEQDLPRYYQAADAFVLPTRELEGFGLITVEALAAGTPVLGTPVGATPEILLPLKPSLVFREATAEAMAEGLRGFLDATGRDPEASVRLRQACRRHAEMHYGWDQSVAELEDTLQRLAQRQANVQEPSAPCPACGGLARQPDLAYLGTRYLRCPECHTGVVATLPSADSLRDHYECDYPRRFPPDRVADPRTELFSSILDRLQRFQPPARLLDLGCGGGHLLAAARQRGWRSLGTDLSHQACVNAHQAGAPAVQAETAALPFRDGSVEAVLLINVLDHVLDPLETLREALRVLIPGGYLAIRIPNAAFHRPWIRFLTSLGPALRWYGWDGYPILHVFAFTGSGLTRLVQRAGFHVLEVRNSSFATEVTGPPQLGLRAVLRWLPGLIGAGAASLEILSRGCLLVGPSIELYARKGSVAEREVAL